MKVAIIGATGFVGRRVVDEALARGIQVTAIARQKKDLPEHANLTIALGDVADTAWLAGQLHGQDAVISAYNPGWGEDNLYEKTTRGAQQILTAVEQAGVKRLLVVGGAGSLEVAPGVELVDTPQFPENIRPGAQAVRDLRLEQQFSYLDSVLAKQHFLLGSRFSVADAYLFTVLRWAFALQFDVRKHAHLAAWFDRVAARPAVDAALNAEGLK